VSRTSWIIIALCVVTTAILYPFSPGGRQRTNMRRADDHIPVLKAQLAQDPRFAKVELRAYTGNGGSLLVLGEVASEDDAHALRAIVERTNPPTPVRFVVQPATGPATRTGD
jgi:hypothetical protein